MLSNDQVIQNSNTLKICCMVIPSNDEQGQPCFFLFPIFVKVADEEIKDKV